MNPRQWEAVAVVDRIEGDDLAWLEDGEVAALWLVAQRLERLARAELLHRTLRLEGGTVCAQQ